MLRLVPDAVKNPSCEVERFIVLTESPVAKKNRVVPVLAVCTFRVSPYEVLKYSSSKMAVKEEV